MVVTQYMYAAVFFRATAEGWFGRFGPFFFAKFTFPKCDEGVEKDALMISTLLVWQVYLKTMFRIKLFSHSYFQDF